MEYFKSEREKYIFILLETDGKTRSKLLGITDDMYGSKKMATEWYEKIRHVIESGTGENLGMIQYSQSNMAIQKLTKIYKIITDYEEEE